MTIVTENTRRAIEYRYFTTVTVISIFFSRLLVGAEV
jgi:hypothetical protein